MKTWIHLLTSVLIVTTLSLNANESFPNDTDTKEPSTTSEVIPIAVKKSYLEGKGLVAQDPSANDPSVTTERPVENSAHTFHEGKITVSIYEAQPARVRIDDHPYDEFVQILEGRLILTLDDGRKFEYEQGDSLIVPKGYTGFWEMPERYRELIVIDTPQE